MKKITLILQFMLIIVLTLMGSHGMTAAQDQTPTPLDDAVPFAPSADDLFGGLEPCRLNAYTEREDLIIGAVVLNLESGEGCTQNLNSVFPFASVGKLFVAGALYEQVALGLTSFDIEMTFNYDYLMSGGQDCLTEDMIGRRITLGELGNLMISCSDNPATAMLMDYLGWDVVDDYRLRQGIAGFGEVMPYTEVDRLKLTLQDERWAAVPRSLASQFYRRRYTSNLVPTYFDQAPRYDRDTFREINARYLETYSYNSATPRAYAELILKWRDDLINGDEVERTVAGWIFNTMLRTQRGFSTQYMPGSVFVGMKNGYDLGYRAEVNIMLSDFETLMPDAFSVIVVKHRDIRQEDIVPFRFRSVPTTEFLLEAGEQLSKVLYPSHNPNQAPILVGDSRVRRVILNTNTALVPCYQNFRDYDYLDGLQQCWARYDSLNTVSVGEFVGLGIIMRNLNESDVRVTMVYTLPNGEVWSFQMSDFFRNSTAVAWFEEAVMAGEWRLDAYLNLVPVYSQAFTVYE